MEAYQRVLPCSTPGVSLSMKRMIRFLSYVVIIFAVLLICISLSTGRAARHYLENWLKTHCDGSVSIQSVSFNPFLFTVNIQDIKVRNRNAFLFSVDAVSLAVSPRGMMRRELVISDADVKGIRSSVKIDIGRADANGFCFPLSHDENASHRSVFALLRKFRLSRASIADGSLLLQMPEKERTFRIEKMLIWDVLVEKERYAGAFSLIGSVDNAKVKVESAFAMRSGRGNATGNLDMKKVQIADFQDLLPPQFAETRGELSIDAKLTMEVGEDLVEITQKGEGTLRDFRMEIGPYAVTNQAADFQTDLLVTVKKGEPVSSRMVASINSEGFEARDTDTDFMVMAWKEAGADRIEAAYRDSFSFAAPMIRAVMVEGARSPGAAYARYPLLSAKKMQAEDIRIAGGEVRIGRIVLDNMEAAVVLDPDAMPVNIPEIAAAEASSGGWMSAALPPPVGEEVGQPVTILLDRLTVAGESRFTCVDESVNPVFSERFRIHMAEIQCRNTAGAFRQYSIAADLEAENGGRLLLDTGLVPVEGSSSTTIWGALFDYPLEGLSPYTRQMWGYDMTAGRLAAETSIATDGGQLSGEILLQLKGVQIAPASSFPEKEILVSAVMPLDAAMGYLVDTNGDGEVLVPVTGEQQNPVYSVSRLLHGRLPAAIRSAAYHIVRQKVMSLPVLVPRGMDPAIYDGELIAGLQLHPVFLEPGEVLPGKDGDEYTRQLSELLKEDGRLRVEIIGVATPQDRNAIAADQNGAGKSDAALSQLARERADTFREILVSHYGVPPSRIAGCRSRVDSEQGGVLSRIEITL